MNSHTKNQLRDLLIAVGQGERHLESLRQHLCWHHDFAVANAFSRINRNQDGKITADELHNFLRDNYSHCGSLPELQKLVKFWNSDIDSSSLTLAEFQPMLLPCENNELKEATLKRSADNCGKTTYLPHYQNHALCAIIEAELALQRKVECMVRWLAKEDDYSVESAFEAVGGNKWKLFSEGKIIKEGKLLNAENMKAFLNVYHDAHHYDHPHGYHYGGYCGHHYGGYYSHWASDNDIQAIIRRLDTNSDNAVDYDEWASYLYVAPIEKPKEEPKPKAPEPVIKPQPVDKPDEAPEGKKEVEHRHHHHGHHYGSYYGGYYGGYGGYYGGYYDRHYTASSYYPRYHYDSYYPSRSYYSSYYPSRSYDSYYHYPSYYRNDSYYWRYSNYYNYSDSYYWRCY